jgi:hypothetical protein
MSISDPIDVSGSLGPKTEEKLVGDDRVLDDL